MQRQRFVERRDDQESHGLQRVWKEKWVLAAGLKATGLCSKSQTPLMAMWHMNYIHVRLFILLELAQDQLE